MFFSTRLSVFLAISILLLSKLLHGQNTFRCDGTFYLTQYSNQSSPTSFYIVDVNNVVTFSQQFVYYNNAFNSIGYNRNDNLIYSFDVVTGDVYRMFSDGSLFSLGKPPLPNITRLFAGDIDNNGIYVLTGDAAEIHRINVSSNTAVVLSTATKFYTDGTPGIPDLGDIVFHPVTNICYAIDRNRNYLATLDPVTGGVTLFGGYQAQTRIGGLFFDAFGMLYGYGYNDLYKIDLDNADIKYITTGPSGNGRDGCSCPYSIDFTKEVFPTNACTGDTVLYVFTFANLTGVPANNVDFYDVMNPNLTFINNPGNLYGGSVVSNTGVGTNILKITGMNIPLDTSSFSVWATISPSYGGGVLSNQAIIKGLDPVYGDSIVSDDPSTVPIDDSTALYIDVVLSTPVFDTICAGQSYTYANANLTTSGTYFDTLLTAGGCDSVLMLTLFVTPPSMHHIDTTVCEGDFIRVGSNFYTTTGLFLDTLSNSSGCDSIVVINLKVLAGKQVIDTTICYGENFNVGSSIYSTSGTYSDTLVNILGCDSIISALLTVLPPLDTNVVVILCEGKSVTIGSIMYDSPGSYSQTLISSFGCDSLVVANIISRPIEKDTLYRSICNGQSYQVGASVYHSSGFYVDTLTSSISGCDSIICLDLEVLPRNEFYDDTTICQGQSVTIGNVEYSTTTTYFDTLSAVNGCDSIVIIDIIVNPENDNTYHFRICLGDSVQLNANPGTTYSWEPSFGLDDATAQYPLAKPTTSMVYVVNYTDLNECPESDSVYVTVDDSISVRISGDSIACEGYLYSLTASGALDYFWSDGQSTSFIEVYPENSTNYFVTGYNGECSSSDTFNVVIEYCECKGFIVPNVFTPNNDLLNDYLQIMREDEISALTSFQIFNRWGEKVFETKNLNMMWDGYYKGNLQEPQVYVYYLDYECHNHQYKHKGSVTLLR